QASYGQSTRRAFGLTLADPVPAPSEDSDFDGETNLWEYFTGTNPADPRDVAPLRVTLAPTDDGRYLTGFLTINPHVAGSLRITPAVSFDLESWDDTPGIVELTSEPFHPGLVLRYPEALHSRQTAFLKTILTVTP
ncbi:MAG: hypothetical protein GWO24_20895, partial [Akkermansiaceae bacterium]|nr:hypothetical protein [Akkermansiaceae bacterium]